MKKTPKDKTITLCMIVKNETHIIKECLQSMLPYIDRYDITDTGSDDGTPELIKEFMDEHDIPGEVYLSDWKGFGDHSGKMGSRTESLQNCEGKADYAWVIDADDFIEGDFKFPQSMDADAYSLRIGREDFTWWRTQIFKMGIDWRYIGVLHEFAECKGKTPSQTDRLMGDYRISARTLGARNVGIDVVEKYTRDAKELEEAMKEEPDNSRYQFYLAQSYFDSQQFEKSLEAYQKRAEMGGWEEEAYYSLYRVAMIKAILDRSWEEIQQAFLDAFDFRPIRAEPLYQIARLYREVHNKPRLGFMFARMALEIPYPHQDILFISEDVYKYQILDEVGACAFYAGKPHIGYHACKRLVDENLVPDVHKDRVSANLHEYEKVMQQIHAQQTQMEIDKQVDEMTEKRERKNSNTVKEKKGTKIQSHKGKKRQKVKR
jgi:glycosyltransferase involved in cell wall biosynthesis